MLCLTHTMLLLTAARGRFKDLMHHVMFLLEIFHCLLILLRYFYYMYYICVYIYYYYY